jgi:pseudaminic acid cytidylyltransferase
MARIAIIPARGGSKRLPRKNVLPVDGRPMLGWPIEAARKTGLFERIVVSTEDSEIAAAAREAGAEVLARPDELAGDRATVVQVCLHVLDAIPAVTFCCIYATAALVKPETIVAAHETLDRAPAADYVMGVSGYNYPPVQALRADAHGFLSHMWPEYRARQSQTYPELCVSNGTFVWARTAAFRRDQLFYGERLRGYRVPDAEVLDIDTREDYEELLARASTHG